MTFYLLLLLDSIATAIVVGAMAYRWGKRDGEDALADARLAESLDAPDIFEQTWPAAHAGERRPS